METNPMRTPSTVQHAMSKESLSEIDLTNNLNALHSPSPTLSQRFYAHYPLECTSTTTATPLRLIDAVLRGHGQVIFCNSPLSGLLTFIGLLFADVQAALFGKFNTSSQSSTV